MGGRLSNELATNVIGHRDLYSLCIHIVSSTMPSYQSAGGSFTLRKNSWSKAANGVGRAAFHSINNQATCYSCSSDHGSRNMELGDSLRVPDQQIAVIRVCNRYHWIQMHYDIFILRLAFEAAEPRMIIAKSGKTRDTPGEGFVRRAH